MRLGLSQSTSSLRIIALATLLFAIAGCGNSSIVGKWRMSGASDATVWEFKGNGAVLVADVRDTGNKHEHSLEAEAEPGVRRSAVTAKIEIPFVIRGIHFVPAHVLLEHFESFFTLAPADDFADAGHQQIHRRNGFPVVVRTHVEGFNLLRKIKNCDGTFEMLFGQPPLVLRLQVQTVIDRKLEFLSAFL